MPAKRRRSLIVLYRLYTIVYTSLAILYDGCFKARYSEMSNRLFNSYTEIALNKNVLIFVIRSFRENRNLILHVLILEYFRRFSIIEP